MRAWVEASCAAQRLPVKVGDAAVLSQVAGLLGAGPGVSRGAASSRARSGPPHGGEPAGIELVEPPPGRADEDVVEDGGDDRVLPGQRQP